jgi:hypothetical protein
MDRVNIDELVDYKTVYPRFVKKYEIKNNRLTGLCPFHEDRKPSFSVDLKSGQYICFACGKSGNYVNFVAEKNGISVQDAYKQILREHGVSPEQPTPQKPRNYTVEDYAAEKKLPTNFLRVVCSLDNGTEKDGTPYVKIPYFDADTKQAVLRKRMGNHSFKWGYGSAGKLIPYGLWRKEGMEIAGYTILVEGESDTQTLWFLGFSALGIPGASTFRPEWAASLNGIDTIYIHVEPDTGGQTFLRTVVQGLKDSKYPGEIRTIACSDFGAKDPSALYLSLGKDAAQDRIEELISKAQLVDVKSLLDDTPVAIEGAPKNLRQPPGWQYGDFGIAHIDEKTEQPVTFCRTPIILTRRLKRIDTGEEKIEIAWKRDGEWNSSIFPRSVIFQSRSIPLLADKGCTVTSENAKQVVRFLGALEQENIDYLSLQECTSTFGWQSRHRFLPGHAADMVLDIDASMNRWATAYCKNGTLENWIAVMQPHRQNYRFRFILAASFAAPLLAIIRQRIFFVYNWGSSRGGKTAALKAALSAWGDPERLMANFNATQVALERMAGIFCDLPLGIDERQLAGNKQESLEKLVYMLSNGTGRSRGSKDGGLQELRTWRSVILATGEEPISKANSQTGVSTRIIEVIGAPFEDEASASDMHQQSSMNCGWAGPEFVRYILEQGDGAIIDEYTAVLDRVRSFMGTHNGSHTAAVATVTLADQMLSRCIFHEAPADAEDEAQIMAELMADDILANEPPDVNEQAAAWISDWIAENGNSFNDTAPGQHYGLIEANTAYVLPNVLREALEKAGFSYRKTITWLAASDIVAVDPKGKYQVQKWFHGRNCRMIAIDMERLQEDPTEPSSEPVNDDFTQLDATEDIPF